MANNAIPCYQMLLLIATPKLADKAAELFASMRVPVQHRISAKGTASSEIMDTLGFGSVDKSLLCTTVPKSVGNELLTQLHDKLRLDAVNSGIAFTIPMTGATNLLVRMMNGIGDQNNTRKDENTVKNSNYTLIAAIVDRGFSGDVMESAKAAGAGGGTVLHSRSIQSEDATSFWGMSVQEEKEIVLILAYHETKKEIMRAISEACGMHSQAKGLVLSLPIDSVMGI